MKTLCFIYYSSVVVVYHTTIIASWHGWLKKFGSITHYKRLFRPAYFVTPTQLLPHPGLEWWQILHIIIRFLGACIVPLCNQDPVHQPGGRLPLRSLRQHPTRSQVGQGYIFFLLISLGKGAAIYIMQNTMFFFKLKNEDLVGGGD